MKKLFIWTIGIFMVIAVGTAVAATVKCTVEYKNDDVVVMTCKSTDKMEVGDTVKVKTAKKETAIEGC